MTDLSVEKLPEAAAPTAPLLETKDLTRHFRVGRGFSAKLLHAADDVNITIDQQQIVALAGESGSGKSTIARLLAGVYKPTSGEIYYQGRALSSLRSRRDQLAYRSDVPMVFQDPFSSLNPAFRVSHGILRSLKLHGGHLTREQRNEEAERVVEAVGLSPAGDIMHRYPYELSGGQRQRIGFAQALAHKPKLILADEPVSMLDVSIRIGLLNLMAELRSSAGVSFLYITHDIASARYVADQLLIMYAGHIVESGPTESVLANPKHPYTDLLLGAVPDPRAPLTVGVEGDTGEPPKVIDPTPGCRFRWRCPLVVDECHHITPTLRRLGEGHEAACHVAQPDPGFLSSQPTNPAPPKKG
ncbi:MAG TPA: ABC transporter ATP-binding protein [Kribbella sp.]|uniref:ABC transporter ATP-binding protein n=1 Tax=Kribbella sp. TaxID=1871183 RepID=UPI002D78CC82|nr:ABC transporter ATP-binding protein [Kribbella sp.]HET6293718.1 ABC transporter ATP-binding protein [Kribbella sp.]